MRVSEQLRQAVLEANLALAREGLARLTWGNVSALDRDSGLVVIKPSGVAYDRLKAEDLTVVALDGRTVEGRLRPSSDLPSHLELYRAWPQIGAVVHTHSVYATMFAQACRPIPCLGTTHADHFYGPVPVTRELTAVEIADRYEAHIGTCIVECFASHGLDPLRMPAVLAAMHGPFAWGSDASEAVHNAVALEATAQLALGTLQLAPEKQPIPACLHDKHFLRKHGAKAYYGQR
ncbi:MAG: L-ribulose-5-phosphate 4-epimerase AraD [Kiritimatiellae bacterium]|nr:L-ribulose-5-phosphate 4-epimerase AraD [Kiritimatiellia bacterium]